MPTIWTIRGDWGFFRQFVHLGQGTGLHAFIDFLDLGIILALLREGVVLCAFPQATV